jgi:uncharacterized membrane protein
MLPGRFHPLILHLPIGLLIGLAAIELLAGSARGPARKPHGLLSALAALGAIAAAFTGWRLGIEDVRGGATFHWHQRLGIAVAVLASAAALAHRWSGAGTRPGWLRLYRALLVAGLLALVPAAHLGGTLTHGQGYLARALGLEDSTGAAAPEDRVTAPDLANSAESSYARHVAPIFEARCAECHGPSKRKGGLALHTPEDVKAGGENGPVLVAGEPSASEIVRRMRLPLDDDDHMPPKKKAQSSAGEIELVERWIQAGAAFAGQIEPLESHAAAAGAQASLAKAASESPAAPAAAAAPEPPPAAVALLRQHLVHVADLPGVAQRLEIDFAAATEVDDERIAQWLAPLADHVAQLSLARCTVGAKTLAQCARMPHLAELDLRSTGVTAADLAPLQGHAALAELVLTGTKVGDAGVPILLSLPNLERAYLWNAGLSGEALAQLQLDRPKLAINAGADPRSEALETEEEPKLARAEPSARKADAPSHQPVNATCPVSKQPVDPRYVIVHEGRVIGFCCAKCPSTFWADPAAFPLP